jgi:putative ABC transport system permease protein
MKKSKIIYVTVMIVIVSVFFYFQAKTNYEQFIVEAIPQKVFLTTVGEKSSVNPVLFTKKLSDFAAANHSLVARRDVVPSENIDGINYQYQTFGVGKMPENMKKSSQSATGYENLAGIGSVYVVLSGPLTSQQLSQFLNDQFSIASYTFPADTPFDQFLGDYLSASTIPVLIILLLSYFCLSLFSKISELRNAGVKLLSGKKHSRLSFQDFFTDTAMILIPTLIASLIVSSLIAIQGIRNFYVFTAVAYGFMFVALGFIIAHLLVGLFAFFMLKRANLIALVKGKLPTWGLMTMAFILLGIVSGILASGLSQVNSLTATLKEDKQQLAVWNKFSDYTNINGGGNQTETDFAKWWSFYDEQISKGSGLYIDYSATVAPDRENDINQGNYLVVSPSYLTNQEIKVPVSYYHLQEGQYGLILPQKDKKNEASLQKAFDNFLTSFTSMDSKEAKISMQAIITSIPNNQKYFIFNNMWLNTDGGQTVSDPVIVVVSPKSMGPESGYFWNNSYFYSTQNYSKLIDDLKTKGLYSDVGFIQSGAKLFEEYLSNSEKLIDLELVEIGVASILSVFFFALIVTLYFAHFRRDIAIKRLSGLEFWRVHQDFLIIELIAIAALFVLMVIISQNLFLSAILSVIQIALAKLTLYVQSNLAGHHEMAILKGE